MISQHLKGNRIVTVFLFRFGEGDDATGLRRVYSALFVVGIALSVGIRPLAIQRAGPKLQDSER